MIMGPLMGLVIAFSVMALAMRNGLKPALASFKKCYLTLRCSRWWAQADALIATAVAGR